jgi:predicted transcriptional regulator
LLLFIKLKDLSIFAVGKNVKVLVNALETLGCEKNSLDLISKSQTLVSDYILSQRNETEFSDYDEMMNLIEELKKSVVDAKNKN